MGALTKTVAPGLAGSSESGSTDLLHMIMGSHAAGQAGMNPMIGLLGGIHSLASGGEPHTAQTLGDLLKQMGLQQKPPETMGGPAVGGFGMMNPPVSRTEPQANPNLKKQGMY